MCDTYLNPSLFPGIVGVVLGLAGAVDLVSLAGRGNVIRAGGGSLPVLHLDGGRTRHCGGRGGNRHEKRRLRERTGLLSCRCGRRRARARPEMARKQSAGRRKEVGRKSAVGNGEQESGREQPAGPGCDEGRW